MKKTFNPLETLCVLTCELKDSKLNSETVKKCATKLKALGEYLGCTRDEAMLFCAIFSIGYRRNNNADLDDISSYFDLTELQVLTRRESLEGLRDKRLIKFEQGNSSNELAYASTQFRVSAYVSEHILSGEPMGDIPCETEVTTSLDFVKKVQGYVDKRDREDIRTNRLFKFVQELEGENMSLPLVDVIVKMLPDVEDRTLFYSACNDFSYRRCQNTDLMDRLNEIYDSRQRSYNVASSFLDQSSPLLMNELVELDGNEMLSDAEMSLTDRGREIFLGDDAKLFEKKVSDKELIKSSSIKEKHLFFAPKLQQQIDFLTHSLSHESYKTLRARLEDMSMPKGVTAIFYGAPGTGKTESVYQLARQTGRNIMHVDISATKSCWFGESEKIIKSIFRKYARLCKDAERTPILLFNEADAIFGKRKEGTASSVAQTENAIQNIILEEMERLDGILVATTNLATNLDAAFERRFLFKIKYEKPTMEAKKSIWRDKLDWLTDEDAASLARSYDFSGGEIDNIVRKATMDELLRGIRPSVSILREMCDDERLSKSDAAKVGF